MVTKIPEHGYKDIFNSTSATILVMSVNAPHYTILDANDAYLQATNSTRESLVGKSVFAAFPANPTDEVSKNIERTIFSFEQAINTKMPHTMSNYRYDIPIPGTNEFEERYWTTTNTPILDDNGDVQYFIHSPVNVTELNKLAQREQAGIEELKNQRQQLAENEQFLKNITTASPTGLWMSDERGVITYVNQTWIDWTRIPYKDHLHEGWSNSILEEDREHVNKKFLNDQKNKSLYEVEFRINHADGTIHWCVATGRPQYNIDGAFTGYIGACIDITEQKLLQQQKDNFIGIASHELKTPVTSIKAYTQLLEKMLLKKGDAKEAGMISRMDGQLNRLTSLIGDLLDVTKINSGKLQFNDREFDFNDYIKEIIEDLQRTSDKHTLVENYTQSGIVYGDKERIGQVITNLITNAIKYSPHSDRIIIHSGLKNNEVVLCVQDFGIGIKRDDLNRVFEQFYRVSGDMQHTFPGLGLGLYISSEIIKREGGRIWVNSKEGKGSTFCFALPVVNK